MFRRLVMAGIALALAGLGTSAVAQKGEGNLVKIGTFNVDTGKDKDTLDLSKSDGKYRGLRIVAADGDITLSRLQVTYGDGSVHNEDRKIVLLDGERTRPIDAGSKDRYIDKLTLDLASGQKGKTKIEVFGIATDEGAKAKRVAVVAAPKAEEKKKEFKAADDKAETGRIAGTATKAESSAVQADDEILFGAQYVGFLADRDVIRVGAEVGKFDRIRLRVLDNDITMKQMKVVYASGEADDIAVNAEIKANTRTKWFDLKGGDRFIREIQFVYNSKPNFKGQARIEVIGEFSDGWLGPNGEGRKFNQGWVLLGADSAGFIGLDKDIIKVGRNEGGFRKIRVTVRDRAISLNELRIVYGNGQEDVVPVKAKVEAGSTYGPIELKGGTRVIKEIQARYRSRFIDKDAKGRGRAIVEVWGQH